MDAESATPAREGSREKMASLELSGADDLMLRLEPIAKWRLGLILTCIGMGLLLSLMDATIVATMLYSISAEFGHFQLSSWIVVAYTLSYVGLAVMTARLADVLGRKTVLLVSFALFLGASMGCAASRNMNELIGFRAMQGAGGAGLYALAMIIYPEISPPSIVPLISSIVGVIVALAGVCGPIVGGLFTSYVNWRWGFWLNGPCAFVPAVVLFFAWPKNFQTFNKAPFRRLDYVGGLLIMVGTVLFSFILNQGAVREYAWNSTPTIVVLILAGLSWIGLVFWERFIHHSPKYRQIRPQFPYRVLVDRVMMATISATTLTGFVMTLTIVNTPLRAQIVNLYDAIKSGVLLLPLMGSMAVGSALGGALSAKRNNTFWTLNAGSALMLLGTGLNSTLTDSLTPEAKQYGFEVIIGLGIGLNLSTSTFITSMQVAFEDHAVAQGIVAQMRVFGGSLGVASSFIVLNNTIQKQLSGILTADQLADFYKSPIAIYSFTVFQQLSVREAYIDAYNTTMRVCMGISVACLIATISTYQRKPPSLEKRLQDLQAVYERSAAIASGPALD